MPRVLLAMLVLVLLQLRAPMLGTPVVHARTVRAAQRVPTRLLVRRVVRTQVRVPPSMLLRLPPTAAPEKGRVTWGARLRSLARG